MSQDFVRSLGDTSIGFERRLGANHIFHLDITMLILMALIVGYGLLVLYSAVDRQSAPIAAQGIKVGVAFVGMVIMAQISPIFYLRLAPFSLHRWTRTFGSGRVLWRDH